MMALIAVWWPTAPALLALWCIASVPLGLVIGPAIKRGQA